MAMDPYDLCPCGSGKKLKWCCINIMADVEKFHTLMYGNQADAALKTLEKLEKRGENPAYLRTLRAKALVSCQGIDEGVKAIDQTVIDFPEFALAREVRGDMLLLTNDFAEALDGYRDAQAHYPAEAIEHHARTLFKIGNCHQMQGRPLAAWAAWQRSLKIMPDFQTAHNAIEEQIKNNPILPAKARTGLPLKSPDEFALFNEDRRVQWDKALEGEREWHLDDIITAFETLTEQDSKDAAAWYNLAISCAWAGDNARAIEAMDEYLKLETDFEAAAEAWDLCEILRLGVGAEEFSDIIDYVAVYELGDTDAFLQAIHRSSRLVVNNSNEEVTLHWLDRERQSPADQYQIQSSPKRLAEISLRSQEAIELIASSPEKLREARESFESVVGATVTPAGEYQRPGFIGHLDNEPLMMFSDRKLSDEEILKELLESTRHYFEDEWLKRPLKSLGGLAPLDAAQSNRFKAKLEGVVRFRERNFRRYNVPYNFDRLRNKLGLEPHENLPPDALVENDISGYSANQLAELDPPSLDDEDLIKAYRTATGLEATETALRFARELVQRDSLAYAIDVMPIFRRLINNQIEKNQFENAQDLVDQAEKFDNKHYEGRHQAGIDSMRARLLMAQGNAEQAQKLYQDSVAKHPENLEIVAEAVENMLSSGNFNAAQTLARIGLERAEKQRNSSYQGQFREYLEEASARV